MRKLTQKWRKITEREKIGAKKSRLLDVLPFPSGPPISRCFGGEYKERIFLTLIMPQREKYLSQLAFTKIRKLSFLLLCQEFSEFRS